MVVKAMKWLLRLGSGCNCEEKALYGQQMADNVFQMVVHATKMVAN